MGKSGDFMNEIENKINQIISEVINEIAEIYLKKLSEYIEKYVYEPKEPKQYKRTYEFLNSFQKLPQAKKVMKEFIQEVYFDSNKLTYNQQPSGLWQHGIEGNNYSKKMAEILNNETLNKKYSQVEGALNIGINGYYWNEFLKYIDENIIRDIKNVFIKRGVMLK